MIRTAGAVRAALGLGLLAAALAANGHHAPHARAAVASRGDPLFTIVVPGGAAGRPSATIALDIEVVIAADHSRVHGVAYAVHGPVGSAVRRVIYTGLLGEESYTYTADRTDRTIVAVTTVATEGIGVPVAVAIRSGAAGSAPSLVAGSSNQRITVATRAS